MFIEGILKRGVVVSMVLLGLGCGNGEPPETGLKLMSYNVLYRLSDPGDTLDLIESWDADVLCLQELTPGFERALLERLGHRYPHRITDPRPKTWGIGIFSKAPIVNGSLKPQLPGEALTPWPVAPYLPHESKSAWGQVPFQGGLLTLSCHHLMPPQHHNFDGNLLELVAYNETTRQVEATVITEQMAEMAPEGGPAVVMGDMNAWVWNPTLDPLKEAGFSPSCDLGPGSCGATFPHKGFRIPLSSRIDHVFVAGADVLWNETIKGGDSDHLPVMVWLDKSRGGSAIP